MLSELILRIWNWAQPVRLPEQEAIAYGREQGKRIVQPEPVYILNLTCGLHREPVALARTGLGQWECPECRKAVVNVSAPPGAYFKEHYRQYLPERQETIPVPTPAQPKSKPPIRRVSWQIDRWTR